MPHHAPSRARRRSLTASISVGATLGILATAWLAVTPASVAAAAVTPVTAITALATGAENPAAGTFNSITAETREALSRARLAVGVALATSDAATASGLDLGEAGTTVDVAELNDAIADLEDFDVKPLLLLPDLTQRLADKTSVVSEEIADLRDRLHAALEKKAAEAAAAAEAERRAAEAAALAAANTPDGAKATAAAMIADYGWGSGQYSCLVSLWTKESGWNYQAYNASSGATGIPQALPGSKMATAGSDWQTNAATQIRWGLDYISRAYGTPCAAWGHSQATNWY